MKLPGAGRVYLVLLSFVLISIGAAYFAYRRENDGRKSLTSETPARITQTEVRRNTGLEDGKEYSVDTIVTYEYELDGKAYQRTIRKSRLEALPFLPWGNAKVCYDPDNPDIAELFPVTHKCGS
jgi:hypothetical protein